MKTDQTQILYELLKETITYIIENKSNKYSKKTTDLHFIMDKRLNEGLSFIDIADHLNTTVNLVRSRYYMMIRILNYILKWTCDNKFEGPVKKENDKLREENRNLIIENIDLKKKIEFFIS